MIGPVSGCIILIKIGIAAIIDNGYADGCTPIPFVIAVVGKGKRYFCDTSPGRLVHFLLQCLPRIKNIFRCTLYLQKAIYSDRIDQVAI